MWNLWDFQKIIGPKQKHYRGSQKVQNQENDPPLQLGTGEYTFLFYKKPVYKKLGATRPKNNFKAKNYMLRTLDSSAKKYFKKF